MPLMSLPYAYFTLYIDILESGYRLVIHDCQMGCEIPDMMGEFSYMRWY